MPMQWLMSVHKVARIMNTSAALMPARVGQRWNKRVPQNAHGLAQVTGTHILVAPYMSACQGRKSFIPAGVKMVAAVK